MTTDEQKQICRDYLADIVMALSAATNLGGEEGDWEEAAEYAVIARDKMDDFALFLQERHEEKGAA